MKRHMIIWAFFALTYQPIEVCGQTVDWFTGGNTGLNPGTSFLGTTDAVPINFRTQNNVRARLYPNDFTFINGYTGTLHQQNGFFALSGRPGFFNMGVGPFSRLHLVDDAGANGLGTYAQQLGWRPWMRNGVTFTGNQDQGYIGQKYARDVTGALIEDQSDMVIQWSNDVEEGTSPDRLRFIFTNEPNGQPNASATGARSDEGLEGIYSSQGISSSLSL